MLKLAGETESTWEKFEYTSYSPDAKDSADLEAGTNTITATSEASGVGSADYSKALTLPKPSDARIVVKRIAARLQVTIDSMTAGHLYCRVYVDAQDADHRLFDEDWTSTGAKLDAVDETSGTLFNLITDGSAHTFYFFFWVDSNNAVISLVQLWEGVGSCSTTGENVLSLTCTGFTQINLEAWRQGTGTVNHSLLQGSDGSQGFINGWQTTDICFADYLLLFSTGLVMRVKGTVSTDLNYLRLIRVILRSEQ